MKTLRIATRESALAMWQTNHVIDLLQQHYPNLNIEKVGMTTRGDQIQDRPLADVGGKALFVNGLEQALLNDQADIAVHSLKDVPAALTPGFALAAICKRMSPFDTFVSPQYAHIDDLPEGAVIGTSGPRRKAQLLAYRSDFTIRSIRGNVQTRLKKCETDEFDATILAEAGLTRLDLRQHIRHVLPTDIMLPAAGQGAVAVECLADKRELIDLLQPLNDSNTAACVIAERACVELLDGNCHSAIGAYATIQDQQLQLNAIVSNPEGTKTYQHQVSGKPDNAAQLGQKAAKALIAVGAKQLL